MKANSARKTAKSNSKSVPQTDNHDGCGHDHGSCCDHDHGGHGGLEVGIRLYKPEDYRELKAVWKAGEIVCDETDNARALKENIDKRKNGFRIFVAEATTMDARGKPVGSPRVIAGVICTYDGRRVYLYHFAVQPEFRGLGLATALLETCEHQAKLWGAKHMRLMSRTDAGRADARRLYEKNGWVAQELCQYSKAI